jgi:hypothetical protein
MGRAKIVLTNYHAFKRKELLDTTKVGRALLQGRGEPIKTTETDGQMLKRACGELLGFKNVLVINDEAHHCYRERPQGYIETPLAAEDKEEAKRNAEAARLWISGLEALKRKVGVRMVYESACGWSTICRLLCAPMGFGNLVGGSPTRAMVGWPGSWQAVRLSNWPDRSPATKAALGGRANRRAVMCVKPEQASKGKLWTPTRP